jgi:glutaredoxin|tara:strand:- start:2294 stop:2557 length:264 start_codon:yes stop_codon:yes gene_type:complete
MKVLIFTMKGCPWCVKLKEQLDEANITYETKDVDEYKTMYDNFVKLTKSELLPAVLVGKNALLPDKSFKTIEQAVEVIQGFLQEPDH